MEPWINAGLDEMDYELLANLEEITGKKHPNPFTCEGFIFILNEIEKRDWTWTLAKMHDNNIMTIYYDGQEVYLINSCLYRTVFLCYLDVLTDLKNRQLL